MKVLFVQNDQEIRSKICWAYANLSNCTDETILKEMIDDKTLEKVIEMLGENEMSLKLPAIRAVGNLLSGSSGSTRVRNFSFFLPLKIYQ